MKKAIDALLLTICLLMPHNNFGYLYQLCVMKKVINKARNQYQLVIGLGDYHDKMHNANKGQRAHLEELLKKCAQVKGKLIVEDLSSINNDGCMNCCNYSINATHGVLGQLAHKARALGVDVDNVEFRYCRVVALGPLLNNIQVRPQACRSSCSISTAALHKEVCNEMEKIKKYDDGKHLNAFYKRTLDGIAARLSKINFTKEKQSTVADYCSQFHYKQYRQDLENLCIFDSGLIDMKIIHSIVSCPGVTPIFIVAGGSHIEQVTHMLTSMGYEYVCATAVATSPSIKKVLNSDCCSAVPSDVCPMPVDLAIIDTFMH